MREIIATLFVGLFFIPTTKLIGQQLETPVFFAIIVSDIDTSIRWYEDALDFELVDSSAIATIGLRQANLQQGNLRLELIELASAIKPANAISDYNAKTKLIGLFKIGFSIDAFDDYLARLKQLKVAFHGNVVNDPVTQKKMIIILDPDHNRIQLFEK